MKLRRRPETPCRHVAPLVQRPGLPSNTLGGNVAGVVDCAQTYKLSVCLFQPRMELTVKAPRVRLDLLPSSTHRIC